MSGYDDVAEVRELAVKQGIRLDGPVQAGSPARGLLVLGLLMVGVVVMFVMMVVGAVTTVRFAAGHPGGAGQALFGFLLLAGAYAGYVLCEHRISVRGE